MSSKPYKVRGRKNFINQQTYREFKKQYPKDDITYEQFISILKRSTETIRDYILENPLGFKLPLNLGYIAIDKFKPLERYFAMDWPATRRLGKRVPLLNLHSFGYLYKVKLYPNPNIRPLRVAKFAAHRILKRMAAKRIKAGKDYLEIDRTYYSRRFRIGSNLKLN